MVTKTLTIIVKENETSVEMAIQNEGFRKLELIGVLTKTLEEAKKLNL